MRAAVYHKYGYKEQVNVEEIPTPDVKRDEVLVKVHAASVNSWDWDLLIGKPRIYRLLFGLFKPKHKVMGSDISGIIEKTGPDVTKFKEGDLVYGDISGNGFGAFAEYVTVPEKLLAYKPKDISHIEAASIPQAGVLALQGFLKYGKPDAGSKVLINGAGGGVGAFGLQIAKSMGLEVTCVDAAEKLEFLKRLGADHVVDYKTTDYTRLNEKFDLIIDVIASKDLKDYDKILNPNGAFVMIGGKIKSIIKMAIYGKKWSRKRKKHFGILAHKPNAQDLDELSNMITKGVLITSHRQMLPTRRSRRSHSTDRCW